LSTKQNGLPGPVLGLIDVEKAHDSGAEDNEGHDQKAAEYPQQQPLRAQQGVIALDRTRER
jgi:hypothetical protein